MRVLELLIIISAMLLPFFGIKRYDLTSYFYWIIVTSAYLVYITLRRWEVE